MLVVEAYADGLYIAEVSHAIENWRLIHFLSLRLLIRRTLLDGLLLTGMAAKSAG